MAPFKKKAETRLARGPRRARGYATAKLPYSKPSATPLLLADDDPTAAQLYAELDTLRGLAARHADKVALLEEQSAAAKKPRPL